MKKIKNIFSLVLVVAVMLSVLPMTVNATGETFTYKRLNPDVKYIKKHSTNEATGTDEKIAVNQGELKIEFNETDIIDTETLNDGITFKDSNGNAPVGGIYTSYKNNTVSVKFGELSEKTKYTLSVNANLKTIDNKSIVPFSASWTTTGKIYAELDADDLADDLSLDVSAVSSDKHYMEVIPGSHNAVIYVPKMQSPAATLTKKSADSGEKYMNYTGTSTSGHDVMLGFATVAPNTNNKDWKNRTWGNSWEHTIVFGKIATIMKFKTASSSKIGLMSEYSFGQYKADYEASSDWTKTVGDSEAFIKDSDGFYNVQMLNEKYDVFLSGTTDVSDKAPYDYKGRLTTLDLNNTERKNKRVKESLASNRGDGAKLTSVIPLSTYGTENSFDVKYMKSGYFTIPETLKATIKTNTLSLQMNTEIDDTTINKIELRNFETNEKIVTNNSYDNATRVITLTALDDIPETITVKYNSLKSKDGFSTVSDYINTEFDFSGADKFTFYISQDGYDGNIGSAQAPFKTLTKIQSVINEAKAQSYNGEIDFIIKSGVYNADNILIDGKDNIKVNVIGEDGTVFTNSKSFTASDFNAEIPDEVYNAMNVNAKDNVLALDLSKYSLGIENLSISVMPIMITVDGKMQNISTYPDTGYEIIKSGQITENTTLTLPRAEKWKYSKDITAMGYYEFMWDYSKGAFENNYDGTLLSEKTLNGQDRLRFINLPEEITMEGEYAIDYKNNLLYYYPVSDFSSADIRISSSRNPAINLDGCKNVKIDNITFDSIKTYAVKVDGTTDCKITNCTFTNIGSAGVYNNTTESKNLIIDGNVFKNMGQHGVMVKGGDVTTLTKSGNVVKNNMFDNFSIWKRTYTPAVRVNGVGNEVLYNTICNSPHAAILYGGSENIISHNTIHNVCTETGDCGAIYSGKNLTFVGNEITYNMIENAKADVGDYEPNGDASKFTAGIYLDDRLGNTIVHHNIIKNADRGIFAGGGSNNKIYSNLIEDCALGIRLGAVGELSYEEDELTKSAQEFFGLYGDAYSKYDLTDITGSNKWIKDAHYNVVENNSFYNTQKIYEDAGVENTWENNNSVNNIQTVISDNNLDNTFMKENISYTGDTFDILYTDIFSDNINLKNLNFKVTTVYNSTDYEVQIAEDSEFKNIVAQGNSKTSDIKVESDMLQSGIQYFVRAVVQIREDSERFTPTYSFKMTLPFYIHNVYTDGINYEIDINESISDYSVVLANTVNNKLVGNVSISNSLTGSLGELNNKSLKVFVWNLTTLKPMCKSVIIK